VDVGEIGISEECHDLFRSLPERAERLAGDYKKPPGILWDDAVYIAVFNVFPDQLVRVHVR
jgi:hypothetical protein